VGAFLYIWVNRKTKPMKTIKLLFLSVILALTSCGSEIDYSGEYLGAKSVWRESSPNNITTSNASASIIYTSQGNRLYSDLSYANGKWLSNRGRIDLDTNYIEQVNIVNQQGIAIGVIDIGTIEIELSVLVSNSEMTINQIYTFTDTLGQELFIEHIDCKLDKQ